MNNQKKKTEQLQKRKFPKKRIKHFMVDLRIKILDIRPILHNF